MKFRKKPVVIDAVQLTWQTFDEALTFLGTAMHECRRGSQQAADSWVTMRTPEGVMVANHGDWIIKGVKGEMYPCKPDVFAMTYEPAGGVPTANSKTVTAPKHEPIVVEKVTVYGKDDHIGSEK